MSTTSLAERGSQEEAAWKTPAETQLVGTDIPRRKGAPVSISLTDILLILILVVLCIQTF